MSFLYVLGASRNNRIVKTGLMGLTINEAIVDDTYREENETGHYQQ